jgi:hypothetical protein
MKIKEEIGMNSHGEFWNRSNMIRSNGFFGKKSIFYFCGIVEIKLWKKIRLECKAKGRI